MKRNYHYTLNATATWDNTAIGAMPDRCHAPRVYELRKYRTDGDKVVEDKLVKTLSFWTLKQAEAWADSWSRTHNKSLDVSF